MKYCSKCGKQLKDTTVTCPECGSVINNTQAENYVEFMHVHQPEEPSGFSTAAIVFAILIPLVGFVLGMIGYNQYETPSYQKKCKIAIILSIAMWIFQFAGTWVGLCIRLS